MAQSRTFFLPFIAIIVLSLFLQAVPPKGWFLAGSHPADYESSIDGPEAYNGHPSAYLKCTNPGTHGFGTLMQQFRAGEYAGKRVRFSASVRTQEVKNWAGLWMRADKGQEAVAFDNMQTRPLNGTTGWQTRAVVLDIPNDATLIAFGVLLTGPGVVWLNNVNLEIVGNDIPTTNQPNTPQLPEKPRNLKFDES